MCGLFYKLGRSKANRFSNFSRVTNFLIEVFSRHGLPQVINMDNGPQLNSDYTKIFYFFF